MEPIIVPITREHEYDITLQAQQHEYDIKLTHGTTISDVVLHRPYHSSQKTLVPLQSGIVLSASGMELGMSRSIMPNETQQIGIKTWPANMRREGDAEELYPVATGIGMGANNVSLVGVRGLMPTADGIRMATQNTAISNVYGIVPSAEGVQLTTASSKIAKSSKLTPGMSSIETGMSEIEIDVAPNEVEVEIIGQGMNYYGSSSTWTYCYAVINGITYTDPTGGIYAHPGDTIAVRAYSSVSGTGSYGSIMIDGVSQVGGNASFVIPQHSEKIIIGLAYNVTSASAQYTYAHVSTSSDYLIWVAQGKGAADYCYATDGSQDIYTPKVLTYNYRLAMSLNVYGRSSYPGSVIVDGVTKKTVTSYSTESYMWQVPDGVRGVCMNMLDASYFTEISINTSTDTAVGQHNILFAVVKQKRTAVESLTVYEAEAGMTWSQFVTSTYNTSNFYTSGGYVYAASEYRIYSANNTTSVVSPSNTITASYLYYANWVRNS